MNSKISKAWTEASGLIRGPYRMLPLIGKVARDRWWLSVGQTNLYSYTATKRSTASALASVSQWIVNAQRDNGGIPAYYSLLSGHSASYPEVTGYLIPTLYDLGKATGNTKAFLAAEHATDWLLTQQMDNGAFPAGLEGRSGSASVFNTGQILQGLVRAWTETGRADLRHAALSAGNWLVEAQGADGSWFGASAYQGKSHSYYSMVAWALALLAEKSRDERYGVAAERNMDWVLLHLRPSGWIDGLGLQGHPNYLHFVAYAIQGVLECSIVRGRSDAVQAIAKPAWILLRKFETSKRLAGAFEDDFQTGHRFACLTGNAQMSCVWLRLFEVTHDLRYLNAALKMNELLKQHVPSHGNRGVVGGVSGSYPIWGAYQPFRYISWGCKFVADALLLEEKMMQNLEVPACAS